MKTRCFECGKNIDFWDVYAEYSKGCMCSSCILQTGVSVTVCHGLTPKQVNFIQAQRAGQQSQQIPAIQPMLANYANDSV